MPARRSLYAFCLPAIALTLLTACGEPETEARAEPTQAEKIVPVTTLLTTARQITETIRLPGDLEPRRRAVLAAEVPGAVEKIRVDEGDRVQAGQVLLEIDTRGLTQRLAEAQAVFRYRQELYGRAEKLLAKKSITERQYLDALTERDVAQAQLESAKLELDKSRLEAPWAGTVAVRRVEVGDYAQPGQPIIELLDVRRLEVRAPAPARELPYLQVGQRAEVRFDVFPGEVFEGTVKRLASELDAAARTLDVEIEIANPEGRLRPGMYAQVEIPRRTLEAAVLVPLASIVELETERVVYVVEEERAVQRGVELGTVFDDQVVVAAGLAVGEQLIVEGQRQVSPGQRVAAQSEDPQPDGTGGV